MRAAIGVLLIGLGLAIPARADDVDERVPALPGGRLDVDLDLGEGLRPDPGSLTVATHDSDEVRVVSESSGWGASGVAFRIDYDESAVRVFGRVGGALSWLFGGPNVQVRIWVPREFSVDVRCSAGSIRVRDVTGNVRARTRDASIEVVGTEGAMKLRTTQGNVRVSEAVGDLDVKVSEGDIELAWIIGDVEARTASGRVELSHVEGALSVRSDRGAIEMRDVDGTVEAKSERGSVFASFLGAPSGLLETRRGSVEIVMPEETGTELDALTRRGDVEIDRGLELAGEPDAGRVAGSINGGGASLRLYTARGNIRVRAR